MRSSFLHSLQIVPHLLSTLKKSMPKVRASSAVRPGRSRLSSRSSTRTPRHATRDRQRQRPPAAAHQQTHACHLQQIFEDTTTRAQSCVHCIACNAMQCIAVQRPPAAAGHQQHCTHFKHLRVTCKLEVFTDRNACLAARALHCIALHCIAAILATRRHQCTHSICMQESRDAACLLCMLGAV
jgi:hypothetical protein